MPSPCWTRYATSASTAWGQKGRVVGDRRYRKGKHELAIIREMIGLTICCAKLQYVRDSTGTTHATCKQLHSPDGAFYLLLWTRQRAARNSHIEEIRYRFVRSCRTKSPSTTREEHILHLV